MLKRRFGNQQRIIDKHMEVLLSVEAVTYETQLKALRRFYDTIEAQVRGLKAMGVTSETYGGLLSSVMLGKIPPEIHLIITRQLGDEDRKLENLMELLLKELEARERSGIGEFAPPKSRDMTGKSPNTAASLLAGGSGTSPTCYYCQETHECRKVMSVDEKKRLLREAGRCFVCLRRGHIVRQCTSKGRCPHCQGRHHGSICTSQKPTTEEPKPSSTGASTGGGTSTIVIVAKFAGKI